MQPSDVIAVHERARSLVVARDWEAAGHVVAGLMGSFTAEELNSGPFAGLYWTFCEEIADHAAGHAPDRAADLYRLALESFEKDASYATSGGEGRARMLAVYRVREKLAAL